MCMLPKLPNNMSVTFLSNNVKINSLETMDKSGRRKCLNCSNKFFFRAIYSKILRRSSKLQSNISVFGYFSYLVM